MFHQVAFDVIILIVIRHIVTCHVYNSLIWNNIFQCFSRAFKRTLECCPLLTILGVTSKVLVIAILLWHVTC